VARSRPKPRLGSSLAGVALLSCALAATQLPLPAKAGQSPETVAVTASVGSSPATLVLAGGSGSNEISIRLSDDGRSYLIAANHSLEVASDICIQPPDDPYDLICEAAAIGSFVFNGGPGNDVVTVGRSVPVPATLYGGADDDTLIGGGGDDKLLGGPGNDRLRGRGGDDWLYGGSGQDRLIGGSGEDICNGGPGYDTAARCEEMKNVP